MDQKELIGAKSAMSGAQVVGNWYSKHQRTHVRENKIIYLNAFNL